MSGPSAVYLTSQYAQDAGVRVVIDTDGRWPFETGRRFDLIVAISVLHHIPDYEEMVRQYAELTLPGGSFISWQDPMWYPRLRRPERWLGRAAYFAWRLGQGNHSRGLGTRLRRMRGVLDDRKVSDVSEYHVVWQGVDELSLQSILRSKFEEVTIIRYWSTQAGVLQRLGQALGLTGTFAIVARYLGRYDGLEPINLGVGREITIAAPVELIARITGFSGTVHWDLAEPDGQPRRALDTSRARDYFGFEARSSFEEGLGRRSSCTKRCGQRGV